MRDRIAITLTLVLIGVALISMVSRMVNPSMYRVTDPALPINYVFLPDDDEFVRLKHHIEGTFWSTREDSVRVSVIYRTPGTDFVEAELQRVVGSDKFLFPLTPLARGERYFYFLRIRDSAGNTVDIKPRRGSFDRLFSGDREKLFYVTYEGRPLRSLLVLHIAFIAGAMLLMIHGFYFSLAHIVSGRGLSQTYWTLLSAWFLFTISVLPLGYSVAKSAFGVGWSGFPIGNDITDNKSLIVVLYWGVLLIRGWKPQKGEYASRTGRMSGTAFAGLSLLGIILTVLTYMIPHSIFLQ
jgi:hypothetical protein